ncbi:hypothetical protein Hanom_Chr02g00112911 [Helianthus anomalus]
MNNIKNPHTVRVWVLVDQQGEQRRGSTLVYQNPQESSEILRKIESINNES